MTNLRADQVGRDEDLWRRIHKDHFIEGRITTAAFKGREMSVDIARLRNGMSETLENGLGIASFSSTVAFENGQKVDSDPLIDNQAHALVIGDKPRRVLRAFRDAAKFTSREEIEAS